MAGYLMVRDTDVWEDKLTSKTYNPIKVKSGYDDFIILKEIESGEELQVKLSDFRKNYNRVTLGQPYNKQFFI